MKGKREEKERRKRGKEKNTTRESNKSTDVCVYTLYTTVPGMKSDCVSEKQQIEKIKKSKKIEKRNREKEKIKNLKLSYERFLVWIKTIDIRCSCTP